MKKKIVIYKNVIGHWLGETCLRGAFACICIYYYKTQQHNSMLL